MNKNYLSAALFDKLLRCEEAARFVVGRNEVKFNTRTSVNVNNWNRKFL